MTFSKSYRWLTQPVTILCLTTGVAFAAPDSIIDSSAELNSGSAAISVPSPELATSDVAALNNPATIETNTEATGVTEAEIPETQSSEIQPTDNLVGETAPVSNSLDNSKPLTPAVMPSNTLAVTPESVEQAAPSMMESKTTAPEVHPTSTKIVSAPEAEPMPEEPLAVQIESLKKQLIKLNRDLFILEEELLFPASTQVSVLLAVDADKTFSLDSIKLKIDDKIVTEYLYTNRQIKALQRGGVQRLYMGNLRAGKHEVTAVFVGYGPDKREYKRAATLTFSKETGQKTIELKISASDGNYQPQFSVVES